MARQRCGPAAGRSIAAGGSGRVWVAALRHLDGAIRSTTPPRRRDTRLPEPCSWKTDAANAPGASVAAFLIFTSRACGAAWRQALAGSTLRSSARGRRGPLRSRGTVAEVCPRSGSIRSSTHLAERHFAARESGGRRGQSRRRARASSTAGAAVSRCLARLRPRRAAIRAWLRWSSQEAQQRHQRVATQSRNAQHPARDTWLPRQTPPT